MIKQCARNWDVTWSIIGENQVSLAFIIRSMAARTFVACPDILIEFT